MMTRLVPTKLLLHPSLAVSDPIVQQFIESLREVEVIKQCPDLN